jgi:hypothetical protein
MRNSTVNLILGLLFALVLNLVSCGSSGDSGTPAAPPSVDATGTWRGTYVSSVVGAQTATLTVIQLGRGITGTYSTSSGALGNVSGSVSSNTATFTIFVTNPGCSGSFTGTGVINATVTPNTMAFTYNGASNASCGGSENGTGNLIKQ